MRAYPESRDERNRLPPSRRRAHSGTTSTTTGARPADACRGAARARPNRARAGGSSSASGPFSSHRWASASAPGEASTRTDGSGAARGRCPAGRRPSPSRRRSRRRSDRSCSDRSGTRRHARTRLRDRPAGGRSRSPGRRTCRTRIGRRSGKGFPPASCARRFAFRGSRRACTGSGGQVRARHTHPLPRAARCSGRCNPPRKRRPSWPGSRPPRRRLPQHSCLRPIRCMAHRPLIAGDTHRTRTSSTAPRDSCRSRTRRTPRRRHGRARTGRSRTSRTNRRARSRHLDRRTGARRTRRRRRPSSSRRSARRQRCGPAQPQRSKCCSCPGPPADTKPAFRRATPRIPRCGCTARRARRWGGSRRSSSQWSRDRDGRNRHAPPGALPGSDALPARRTGTGTRAGGCGSVGRAGTIPRRTRRHPRGSTVRPARSGSTRSGRENRQARAGRRRPSPSTRREEPQREAPNGPRVTCPSVPLRPCARCPRRRGATPCGRDIAAEVSAVHGTDHAHNAVFCTASRVHVRASRHENVLTTASRAR